MMNFNVFSVSCPFKTQSVRWSDHIFTIHLSSIYRVFEPDIQKGEIKIRSSLEGETEMKIHNLNI